MISLRRPQTRLIEPIEDTFGISDSNLTGRSLPQPVTVTPRAMPVTPAATSRPAGLGKQLARNLAQAACPRLAAHPARQLP